MPQKDSYFFVSYSRQDASLVHKIVSDLNEKGINTWVDSFQLHAGDNWQDAITNGLEGSIGVIVFLSNASMKSNFVLSEVNYILRGGKAPVFPILLEDVQNIIPTNLLSIQWFDFRDATNNYDNRIRQLVDVLNNWIDKPPADISKIDPKKFTDDESFRASGAFPTKKRPPQAVFLVHGHDKNLRDEVKSFLVDKNVAPIILVEEKNNQRQSIFDKFYEMQAKADFAVILLSSDDIGASIEEYYRRDPEGARLGERVFEGRGRQNVIFEMGFFFGRKGIDGVFVLEKRDGPFRYNRPSDLDGRTFEDYNNDWKQSLTDWLISKRIIE
ncbi:MAG: TIR domain-containing protein [Anaerolineaceae bacterium]|nr:TIR domain-containing protein [Anaerolineaceae bacterium]